MNILQPADWPRPKGYSNGIVAEGRLVFLAGMIGWTESEALAAEDFVGQARQALTNIVTLLREAGAVPENIVRMTWYVADKTEYLNAAKELGDVYRKIIGRSYPPMTVVEVSGFVEEGAKLEIETTAVIPPA